MNGAITLGTNICARGTNIKVKEKPLHVIVSYYTSNTRVMNQAYGRTGRQGQQGTTRVICLKSEYLFDFQQDSNESFEKLSMKNKLANEFIQKFNNNRQWIFNPNKIEKQTINTSDIKKLREYRINVNRIVAYNYNFPIIMKIDTFLQIQTQKIFSLINCPNTIYTWRIFQRYVREMILEPWSLMIDKFNVKYKDEENYSNYKKIFINKIDKLYNKLELYLPPDKNLGIIPTFIHICDLVVRDHQENILKSFKALPDVFKQFNKIGFFSVQVGFKLYSLLSKSGAKITYKNLKKMNYITDPELKYEQREPKSKKNHFVEYHAKD